MQDAFEKIIDKLKKELKLADEEKLQCARENPLQFDSAKGYAHGVAKAIEIVKQEAKQYNNGWIPYSERLPDDKQRCLTTAKIYFVPDHVDEEDNYIGVAIDTYFEKFGWSSNPEVIAWQPLPEPYQPKGE